MNVFIASIISALHSAKARLHSDERGATMVEYGIMVAFIAVVVMAVVVLLGPKIADLNFNCCSGGPVERRCNIQTCKFHGTFWRNS